MMQYKGYVGKVEFDDEAKTLHGEVVGLRDVVTFEADSLDAVEKAFHDSVDDYLAFCKERGEQPDKPFSGQFLVRTDSDLHRLLNVVAHTAGKSLNAIVVEFLGRGVAQALAAMKVAAGERPKLSTRRPIGAASSSRPVGVASSSRAPKSGPGQSRARSRKERREGAHA